MKVVMQKDLKSLIEANPNGVEMILTFSDGLYHVFFKAQGEEGKPQRLYTQRKDPKTFIAISRALLWGEVQGFKSVTFFHQW